MIYEITKQPKSRSVQKDKQKRRLISKPPFSRLQSFVALTLFWVRRVYHQHRTAATGSPTRPESL